MRAFISTLTSIAVLLHVWLGCEVHHASAHAQASIVVAEAAHSHCERSDSSPSEESEESSCDECACAFRDAGTAVQKFWPPDFVALTTIGAELPLCGTQRISSALEDRPASSAGKFSVLYCVMRN